MAALQYASQIAYSGDLKGAKQLLSEESNLSQDEIASLSPQLEAAALCADSMAINLFYTLKQHPQIISNLFHRVFNEIDHFKTKEFDIEAYFELVRVNKHFYGLATTLLTRALPGALSREVNHRCYVFDTQMKEGSPPPFINRWKVCKWVNDLGPEIEGDLGCTILIMREGLTFQKQLEEAAELGITTRQLCNQLFLASKDSPVRKTYAVLATNNIFKNSRNKSFSEQEKQLITLGAEPLTLQENAAVCALNLIGTTSNCPYPFPSTLGRTSTFYNGQDVLMVAGYKKNQSVRIEVFSKGEKYGEIGIGGKRKLS